jgi:coenzyme F420-0:L-glutamate ligase/coenzyme F420-1:gamma-L-glutamate ligase
VDPQDTALAAPLKEIDAERILRHLLLGRRSIRRYKNDEVPGQLITELLEAAITARSPHNRQPWRFLVIQRTETKQRLAMAMGARLRYDRMLDGDPLDAIEKDVSRSYTRLTCAPVLLVVCTTLAEMDQYPDTGRHERERIMAIQATAMAVQNLLLAAHAANLGTCWMCAPLFCPDVVSGVLALPGDWEPQAIVTLGYPADDGKPIRRRRVLEVTVYDNPTS